MDTHALREFNAVAKSVIDDTRAGKLVWTKVNPTTFSWSGNAGHMLVQEVSQTVRASNNLRRTVKGHLFQVLNKARTPQLIVSSIDVPSVDDVLREMFEAVGGSFTKQGVDFLRGLLQSEDIE